MHFCPDCGSACYCNGDLDDCPVYTEVWAYENCQHSQLEADECKGNPEASFDSGDDYDPFDDDDWEQE